MNKKEYKEKLEVILDLHRKNSKNLCNAWYIRDIRTKRYALSLYIFVELLILNGFCQLKNCWESNGDNNNPVRE
jgi:hypothetical protein